MTAELNAAERDRLHARVEFFRQYYGPIAVNSRHGLAVVDVGRCAILFANARFLASHQLPPNPQFPIPCSTAYGSGACTAAGGCCPAAAAARSREEHRTRVQRQGGDGLPARTTEVVATPLARRGEHGTDPEVLVVEKEDLLDALDPEDEREHLAAIARHSADAIISLDSDGRIRTWNQGAVDTFGYTADETVGRDFRFLVPDDPQHQRQYDAMIEEFRNRGYLRNRPARLRAKDGRTVICAITRSWVRDSHGNPRGASVICRDVTMETLLRELIEHQLRAMSVTHEIGDLLHSTRSVDEILQLILVGVTAGQGLGFNRAFLLLVEDGPARRLRGRMAIGPSDPHEANRIWRALSGETLTLTELHRRYREESHGHDEAVNRIAAAIDVALDDPQHVLARVVRTRRALNVLQGRVAGEHGRSEQTEVDRRLIDLLRCDSFAVVPLNTRERAIGALLVDNHITGIPVSEADLQMLKVFANHAGIALENSQLRAHLERRLAELERLNRALKDNQEKSMRAERLAVIGELAARVVHEVRNPLVAIGGFARLVRKGMNADDPRSDYLRIISDEVARLERIVQELLDFSRPQNRVRTAPVDVNALVHEVVMLTTVEAEAHGVAVREDYDPAIGTAVIDPDKTRQVLINILKNAVDVLVERGGEVRVETQAMADNRFRVTIRDDGPGIAEEQRERVFQPGFTTRPDGTGFGLAIAKRLVELQGGQITLREGGPKGCTFDIVIPRKVVVEDPRP